MACAATEFRGAPRGPRADLDTIGRATAMRRRKAAIVTLAAAAVAAGVAIPAFASASSGTAPPFTPADSRGSGQSVIDWNRELSTILGTPGVQPATIHPTRSFAMLQAA